MAVVAGGKSESLLPYIADVILDELLRASHAKWEISDARQQRQAIMRPSHTAPRGCKSSWRY